MGILDKLLAREPVLMQNSNVHEMPWAGGTVRYELKPFGLLSITWTKGDLEHSTTVRRYAGYRTLRAEAESWVHLPTIEELMVKVAITAAHSEHCQAVARAHMLQNRFANYVEGVTK